MNVYEIIGDHGSEHFVRGVWSEDHTSKKSYEIGTWTPTQDLKFTEDGRIDPEDVDRFSRHWLVVVVEELPELDAVGKFGIFKRDLPAIKGGLKDALIHVSPGVLEFLETDRIWAEKQNTPLSVDPFYLANLLKRADCWDPDAMEIAKMRRKDGTTFEIINGAKKAVKGSRIPEEDIWREERTGNVLCTEKIKRALEEAGCRGWYFYPIQVTGN